jgi:hypothetical protein
MVRPGVPRSLAGDGGVGAGGPGLLDVPGHAFGPRRHRQINSMMAARRARSIRPAPNRHFCVAGNVRPHLNQVSAESVIRSRALVGDTRIRFLARGQRRRHPPADSVRRSVRDSVWSTPLPPQIVESLAMPSRKASGRYAEATITRPGRRFRNRQRITMTRHLTLRRHLHDPLETMVRRQKVAGRRFNE